jgi:hypothetical protein
MRYRSKHLVGEDVESVAHENLVVIGHTGAEVIRNAPVGPGAEAFGSQLDPTRHPARV